MGENSRLMDVVSFYTVVSSPTISLHPRVKAVQDKVADVPVMKSWSVLTSNPPTALVLVHRCFSNLLQIWLSARGGALPAGSKVSQNPVTIEGGYAFDVYKGVVGGIPVISLVPSPANQEYTKFSADLIPLMGKLPPPPPIGFDHYTKTDVSWINPSPEQKNWANTGSSPMNTSPLVAREQNHSESVFSFYGMIWSQLPKLIACLFMVLTT